MGLLEEFESWTPSAKARTFERLQEIKERRLFYCKTPGRKCDGKPHAGVPYNHARADQWPPAGPGWLTWALVGGRGSGKTRAGAEYVRKMTAHVGRVAIIGATGPDARETMIEGDSGLIKVCEQAGEKVEYFPSRRRLEFANGAIGSVFSGEEPNRLRGPQHGLCFPAGTLVHTATGPVPIEHVSVGDMVYTRAGRRRVRAVGSRRAQVYSLHHEAGVLAGTAEHPVWTQRGWVQLALVRRGDVLSTWIGEKAGQGISTHTTTGRRFSVDPQRSAPNAGQERCDSISTLLTATANGSDCVNTAEDGFSLETGTSVVSGVSTSGVVGVVYNLTVEGDPEFFADGVLVHNCWLDEPAHYPLIQEVWDMMLLGLRLGKAPRIAVTTTPVPTKWLKALLKGSKTRISRVSTYENLDNLAGEFAEVVLSMYEGTRLGKQELYGEVLEDVEGALWNPTMFHHTTFTAADMDRVVVAIDPAGTANRRSDETGIIAVGRRGKGLNSSAFVLADKSGKYSPSGWADAADKLYRELGADAIVVEKNFGGDMVKTTLENSGTSARIIVKTAMRSKKLRAEPVVALYEKTPSRVYHVPGLIALEEEQLTWVPGVGDSPNRVDALVWGVDDLIDTHGPPRIGHAKSGLRIPRPVSIGSFSSALSRLGR